MKKKLKKAKHDPREKLLKYWKNNEFSMYFFLNEAILKCQEIEREKI